jgi:SAM-dependent methyltransferase
MATSKKLDLDATLRRAPGVRITLDSADRARIAVGNCELVAGPHSLAVLDVFSRPTVVARALEELQRRAQGARDWMELTNTVISFFNAGILVDPAKEAVTVRSISYGYDNPGIHIDMLNDRTRTSAFLEAIRQSVRPDDVVVEIGTGTGILATAAALAGARHVYAIEAGEISKAAREVARANGVEDRVTIVRGWSTQTVLPERGTLLVSEMLGDEPLDESILDLVVDAQKRLLLEDARVIPAGLQVYALPMTVPRDLWARSVFGEEEVRKWEDWYGVRLQPLEALRTSRSLFTTVRPARTQAWEAMAEPVLLADINLARIEDTAISSRAACTATRDGLVSGVVVYFESDLASGVTLSTDPRRIPEDNHWHNGLWVLTEPVPVRARQQFTIGYDQSADAGERVRVNLE